MGDTAKEIGKRLERTRLALGYETQTEFAERLGIAKNIYNPFEKGKRRVSLEIALKMRAEFGIPLDWIYCGDESSLSVRVYNKILRAG